MTSTPASSEDVLILGSGPAGFTAGIYTARAQMNPLMLDRGQPPESIPLGQLALTTEVENFPGFPEGVMGPELMEKLSRQAVRFGLRIQPMMAVSVDLSKRPFTVKAADPLMGDEATFQAQTLIIATGANANWLNLESEQHYRNRGVSACATCDGALFAGREVVVVGGGDSAMEEALFLTRFCPKVTLLVRRDKLRASKVMQERAATNPKVEIRYHTGVEEVLGDDREMTGLRLKNTTTGEVSELAAGGLFLAIGHTPNAQIFKDWLELDEKGYIKTQGATSYTSVPGVFACGDVQDARYRQAITAAGSGCMAAIDAERWLAARQD